MRDDIQIVATISFKHNLEKLYPYHKSTKERIRELNKILEELLYGTKDK